MANCFGGRIYKGGDLDLVIPFEEESDMQNFIAKFYTDNTESVEKDYEELTFTADTVMVHFEGDELDFLADGVLRYKFEYDSEDDHRVIESNTAYYLKTPIDYSGHTKEEVWEDGYESGYTDGARDASVTEVHYDDIDVELGKEIYENPTKYIIGYYEFKLHYDRDIDSNTKCWICDYFIPRDDEVTDYAQNIQYWVTLTSNGAKNRGSAATILATKRAVDKKQDTLIAGENITISGNVISAVGGGITSGDVQTMIDQSISGKVDQGTLDEVVSAVTRELAGKATSSALEEGLQTKQNVIPDLDNIKSGAELGLTALQPDGVKTINGQSIVGSGNIELHNSKRVWTLKVNSSDGRISSGQTGLYSLLESFESTDFFNTNEVYLCDDHEEEYFALTSYEYLRDGYCLYGITTHLCTALVHLDANSYQDNVSYYKIVSEPNLIQTLNTSLKSINGESLVGTGNISTRDNWDVRIFWSSLAEKMFKGSRPTLFYTKGGNNNTIYNVLKYELHLNEYDSEDRDYWQGIKIWYLDDDLQIKEYSTGYWTDEPLA